MIYNKTIIGFIVLIALGGMAVVLPRLENRISVENTATSTATILEEVVEEYPSDVLERAVKAQEDVLRLYDLEQEKTLLQAEIAAQEARIEEIDKETGNY
jgi:hypothetical protein